MVLTFQVAHGSVGSPWLGMIVDRLELGACDLELFVPCILYLGIVRSFSLDLQDLHLLLFGYGLDLLSKLVGQSLCLFKASSLVVFRDFLVLQ